MKKFVTVAAGATIIGLLGAGTGYAGGQITGSDIARDTVASRNIKNQTIKLRDLRPGAIAKLKGQTVTVTTGTTGTGTGTGTGTTGNAPGTSGQTIAANATTPANSQLGGQPVVVVPRKAATGFASTDGVALISVDLPAGHYIVTGTALLFQSVPDTADPDYGEVRLFAGTVAAGSSIYTPEVPAIAGAQTTASVEVTLTQATTITLRALLRSVSGNPSAFGGGNLLVTSVAS